MMNIKILLLVVVMPWLLAVTGEGKVFEFSYPKVNGTGFTMRSDKFKKFTKEWRGTDYYYYAESSDGFICSVFYYKLNQEEKLAFVDAMKAMLGFKGTSPAFALSYFSTYSPTKQVEVNEEKWGDAAADFMFSQVDIPEMEGHKINQKNMHGYAMAADDLFINIHLSKVNCSPADSIVMRDILASLQLSK